MGRIDGKVALVTGGASGIGEAVARRFAREGAHVILADMNADAGARIAADCGAHFQPLDVSQEAGWAAAMDAVQSRFGRLDILMNNAGIIAHKTIEDTTLDDWNRVIGVNLTGMMLGCRFAVAAMKANPGGSGGSIINVGSTTSFLGLANDAAYTASKAGVIGLTRSIAAHCAKARLNIRCNSVHPGATLTAILQGHMDEHPELRDVFNNMSPVGRMGDPAEIANMALYLASDESSFSTGAQFVVDGGLSSTHPAM